MSRPIGGQAVIEGVMMRDQQDMTIAVRCPDSRIHVVTKKLNSLAQKYPFLKLPVLRGVLTFFESLVLGVKTLNMSMELALEEEEETLEDWQVWATTSFALILGILLFILLPTFLVRFLLASTPQIPLVMNISEGALRLLIFLGYLVAISRMKDIQRVFQYHGAEHMVIHCYEAGMPLTVENSRKFSPLHTRCGTSFLLLVMVISIIFFSFFGWPNLGVRILTRLALLPLVAGLSYEAIRYLGRKNNWLSRIISCPGVFLQRFTTRIPEDSQLEVALKALEPLVNGDIQGEPPETEPLPENIQREHTAAEK